MRLQGQIVFCARLKLKKRLAFQKKKKKKKHGMNATQPKSMGMGEELSGVDSLGGTSRAVGRELTRKPQPSGGLESNG